MFRFDSDKVILEIEAQIAPLFSGKPHSGDMREMKREIIGYLQSEEMIGKVTDEEIFYDDTYNEVILFIDAVYYPMSSVEYAIEPLLRGYIDKILDIAWPEYKLKEVYINDVKRY